MNRTNAEPSPVAPRRGRLEDVAALARLMLGDLQGSRLVELGPGFVTVLNRHMVTSPHCICLVAGEVGEVVGYIVVAPSTRAFYRDFIKRKGVLAALVVLPHLLRPSRLRTLLKGLRYFPQSPQADPDAEIIVFVISPAAQRSGVGSALFRHAVEALRARGVGQMKIVTGIENDAANRFYQRQGSRFVRSEPFYRDTRVNVYVYDCV